jgi:hypothetical protein
MNTKIKLGKSVESSLSSSLRASVLSLISYSVHHSVSKPVWYKVHWSVDRPVSNSGDSLIYYSIYNSIRREIRLWKQR